MVKFRQKDFTIQEGHYTGPKDIDKVPGVLEVLGKSVAAGSAVGAIAGNLIPEKGILDTAFQGGKVGLLAGLFYKFLINHIHKPMSTIKYSEVDKMIRRDFGIYRVAGVTVGDSLDKRANLDQRFSFNDREVTNYKLNIAIQDNQVSLYTFGITDQELEKINKSLDYYCKKYYGMNYNASLINQKVNAYSVTIIFTNYQVISNFILELSNVLNCKINLLDSKALVTNRIVFKQKEDDNESKALETEEKHFSTKLLNKYDLFKILGNSGMYAIARSFMSKSWGRLASSAVISLVLNSLAKLTGDELSKLTNSKAHRHEFSNRYLEDALKKLNYIEGFNYTVGKSSSELNISLVSGLFIATIDKKSPSYGDFEKKVYSKFKSLLNRTDTGDVLIYTYLVRSREEFNLILKQVMSTKAKPNVFEK